MNDWHGWSIKDHLTGSVSTIHIGPLPKRTQIAMYEVFPNTAQISVLAYFRDKESAMYAMQFIDKVAKGVSFDFMECV